MVADCPKASSRRLPHASQALVQAALASLLIMVPACGSDADDTARITSSQAVADMDPADFQERCDERGGVVEIIPHCGGLNTCKGFSYDYSTQLLSEHTCRGAATCGGFNCVID